MIRKITPVLAAAALVGSFTFAVAQTGATGTGSMGNGAAMPSDSTGRSMSRDNSSAGQMNKVNPNSTTSGNQTRTGGPSGGRTDSN